MATIEQTPPAQEIPPIQEASTPSLLNSLLARAYTLNWEAIFYIVLFAVAVLTRFVNLGDRVMSHDESLHTTYSYNLYTKGEFAHTPLMHGPVLFHMTALMYFLFGDSDFSARLYPAILGIIMVMMPKLLFERWLGKRGAMVASILLLISPMVLYHNRYIREDTPSIFFTLLMIYAIFAYIDGVRPRQIRWLLLLSGSMLLSLASKEVAFMYIAIFGLVLTIFWLFQVNQGVRSGFVSRSVGQVIGGVLLLGAAAAVGGGVPIGGLLIGNSVSSGLAAAGGAQIPGLIFAIPAALILCVLAALLILWLRYLVGRPAENGRTTFMIVMAGFIIGSIAALTMTCFMTIIPTTDLPGNAMLQGRLVLWVTLLVLVLALVVIGTALVAFARSARLPWRNIILLFLVAALVCGALVVFEERSRNVPNTSVDRPKDPAGATSSGGADYQNGWLAIGWVFGVVAVGLIVALRLATPFFEEMKRYPVFDVLIVMGTLILPWLSAVPIWLAGYPLDDQNPSVQMINAGIVGTIPFVVVAIVAGMIWNPQVWLACAATFYSIFAFFFTTIFTNINGMFTGLVGSLGYWLVQQGVRRGSQPQYYYLLVELPVYEYLPMIGAAIAGIAGMFGLWRFRAARMAEAEQQIELPNADPLLETYSGNPEYPPETPTDAIAVTQISALNETLLTPTENQTGAPLNADYPVEPTDPISAEDQVITTAESETDTEPVEPTEEERRRAIAEPEWLDRMPFLVFVGFWAVMIIYAFTIAGEKMPWLTTHLTVPLIFATGWYVGGLLDKVDWASFWKRSWGLAFLAPLLIIALINVFGPFLINNAPFSGLEREDLLKTSTWFGAVLLAGLVGYAIYRIWRQIGTGQAVRIIGLGAFLLLAILTARTAWRAAYIDYDYATEFLVYAHGAPANKTVINTLENLSKLTTDGMNIRVAYDNLVSWPGSWYFRSFPQASYKGDMTGVTDLDTYAAVVLGDANNSKVESQLADKFYKFRYARLWWPMQDYFNLTVERIDHLFSPFEYTSNDNNQTVVHQVAAGDLLRGVWDIWWDRDYTTYAKATGGEFAVSKWPVADWMYFYVRKDIAAQVWNFGVGGVKPVALPEDPLKSLHCVPCQAELSFGSLSDQVNLSATVNRPRGMAVGPDGSLYVADSQNNRIAVFTADGQFVRQIGVPSNVDNQATGQPQLPQGGTFREPWSVAVGQDGTVYVADTWNHRVQVFNSDGVFVRMWGQFEQVAPGQPVKPDSFWGPRDITVDKDNRVYVADTGNKRIRVYDQQGTFLYDIGQAGANMGQLNEPVGITINQQTNELFVADTWNKRIDVFDLSGAYRRSWAVQAWTTTTESGTRPYLVLDKDGTHLFVTDPDVARVLVFDTNGTPILSFGMLGTAPNFSMTAFGTLGGITMDKAGHLFVSDAGANRVLRLAPQTFPGLVPLPPIGGDMINPPVNPPGGVSTEPATPAVF